MPPPRHCTAPSPRQCQVLGGCGDVGTSSPPGRHRESVASSSKAVLCPRSPALGLPPEVLPMSFILNGPGWKLPSHPSVNKCMEVTPLTHAVPHDSGRLHASPRATLANRMLWWKRGRLNTAATRLRIREVPGQARESTLVRHALSPTGQP